MLFALVLRTRDAGGKVLTLFLIPLVLRTRDAGGKALTLFLIPLWAGALAIGERSF